MHPLREIGITKQTLRLVFSRCWQIKTNLLGHGSNTELISTFEVETESGLKQYFLSFGIGNHSIMHFRIVGSAGSQLDFLAEGLSVLQRH